MAQKSIFIASALESKEVAMAIAQELANNGYRPLRWWKEFPAGSLTIERILEIAKNVDGAVFVCSGLDKIWYRSDNTSVPRDNVVLEYGIFLASLGLRRALLLKDDAAKLPSDLQALSYERLLNDTASVAEKVVSHFNGHFSRAALPWRTEALNIVADPEVVAKQIARDLPIDWLIRAFYVGIEGAKAWLAVSYDPVYQSEQVKADLRRAILGTIKPIEVRTLVSLGPGDGLLDKDIAIFLRNREPWLQYIPVDISDGLLELAYVLLAQQVRVPLGILGDFEDRLNFINHYVRVNASSPILYTLVGNTFGNLDRFESAFMHNVKSNLSSADYLLMEVALLKRTPAAVPASIPSLSKGFRYFLSCGVARKFGLEVGTVLKDLDSTLSISFSDTASDVPGTHAETYRLAVTGQSVAYVRRYDFELLQKWLKEEIGLKIVDSQLVTSGLSDRGILLLKK